MGIVRSEPHIASRCLGNILVPKRGKFIDILNRVRKHESERESRESAAWRTYLSLAAQSEARLAAASASGLGSGR